MEGWGIGVEMLFQKVCKGGEREGGEMGMMLEKEGGIFFFPPTDRLGRPPVGYFSHFFSKSQHTFIAHLSAGYLPRYDSYPTHFSFILISTSPHLKPPPPPPSMTLTYPPGGRFACFGPLSSSQNYSSTSSLFPDFLAFCVCEKPIAMKERCIDNKAHSREKKGKTLISFFFCEETIGFFSHVFEMKPPPPPKCNTQNFKCTHVSSTLLFLLFIN